MGPRLDLKAVCVFAPRKDKGLETSLHTLYLYIYSINNGIHEKN